ncbi:MAG: DUF1631 family protein [Candidatus Accumulibacter sp. UW20]|jgi:hypothetical protein
MAVSVDNVIRFPEGSRLSTADSDRPQTLAKARSFMAHKLGEALALLLPRLEEELLASGDIASGRAQREFCYGTRETIHEHAQRLPSLLATRWLDLAEQRMQPGARTRPARVISEPEDLQLVDFGAMDHELAVTAISGRLRSACDESLFGAGRRLGFLSGESDANWPVEDLIAQSVDKAFAGVGLSGMAQLELLRAIERHASEVFGPAIDDLNVFLLGCGVLPKLRRSYFASAADKKHPIADENSSEATDLFALLQKLVASPPVAAAATVAGLPDALTPRALAATGMPLPAGTSGRMAVAIDDVMATLQTLQWAAPAPVVPDPGKGNVLRDFRASDTGQSLDELHAVTVDIVATLFDFIFDDAAVADPIKALVARLQIPVLKVALLDKSFFSSKAHPARRLLNGISRAAVRCGPTAGHDDPLYARLAQLVDRVQSEFRQDTGLFDLLCVELDGFLDGQEATADARAVEAAPLVAEQELRDLAALAAEQVLAGWLAKPLPAVLIDLLHNEWRSLLIRHYVNGDDSAWGVAKTTIADLVASVQPQPDAISRKRLAVRLPALVRRIYDDLDCLQVAEARRLVLVDSLFTLHAAVLRGTVLPAASALPALPKAEPASPQISSEHIASGDTSLERIFLSPGCLPANSAGSEQARSLVAGLQRGDWIEFANAGAGPMRYRLSWISPQRGILLLTNPQSPQALSVSPDALAVQFERGEAALVAVEPIFERAVKRALAALKAA